MHYSILFNTPLRGENEFARGNAHINGIESFWGYAKTRLVKFKGMDKKMFNLHLKECEFRFNNRLSCHAPNVIIGLCDIELENDGQIFLN